MAHQAHGKKVFDSGSAADYIGPGSVTEAVTFERRLQTVNAAGGYVVAGVREQPQASWGPLYGNLPLTTSLIIRLPGGSETSWRPQGPHSFLAGYPTSRGVVVLRRTPRPASECAPAVTDDCESWELILLDPRAGSSRSLLAGRRPVPVDVTPALLVRPPLVLLTDAGVLREVDLSTLRVRKVADVPSGAALLSGSPTGLVFVSSTNPSTPGALVSVNTVNGTVSALPPAFDAVAGESALAWVEPQPGDPDGSTRIRVRPFGARRATAFGVRGVEVYYVRWVTASTLLAVTDQGLVLYSDALSAAPRSAPLVRQAWELVPEVGVTGVGGDMSFGLLAPDGRVRFFAVHLA